MEDFFLQQKHWKQEGVKKKKDEVGLAESRLFLLRVTLLELESISFFVVCLFKDFRPSLESKFEWYALVDTRLRQKERQRKRGQKAKWSRLQYWSSNGI